MHSFIFIGDNREKIGQEAEIFIQDKLGKDLKRNPDFWSVGKNKDTSSISIAHIKEAIQFLYLSPFISPLKTVCIFNADFMTEEAQNALLKTLEEPPVRSLIVLTALEPEQLLDTVRSRSSVIRVQSSVGVAVPKNKTKTSSTHFYEFSRNFDTIKTKDEVVGLIDDILLDGGRPVNIHAVKELLKIKKLIITTNINARLALENWYLKYKFKTQNLKLKI